MEQRIEKIEKQLERIVDNELVHLRESSNELKVGLSIIGTNVTWLMKNYWVVVSTSVGSIIAAIFGLILK